MDPQAAAKAKEKVAKHPEEDASSGRRKPGLTLPMKTQMPDKQKDNGMMVNGQIPHGMTGPGTTPKSPTQPREKERKERRAIEKASMERIEKMERSNATLPMLPRAVQQPLLRQPSLLTTRSSLTCHSWPPK